MVSLLFKTLHKYKSEYGCHWDERDERMSPFSYSGAQVVCKTEPVPEKPKTYSLPSS